MIAYVIAGVVLLILLIGAYRVFGGAASQEDTSSMLPLALDEGDRLASELGASIAAVSQDAPQRLRRRAGGLAQLVARIDVTELAGANAAAHPLVATAADDLEQASRLRTSGTFATSDGVQQAAATLVMHAGSCLQRARKLLAASGAAEELHGPGQP